MSHESRRPILVPLFLLLISQAFGFTSSLQAQSAPSISYPSPPSGPVGAAITIVGQHFGPTQGSSTVTFGGVAGTPTSWTDTQIVVPVPSGAPSGTAYILVTTSAGSSSAFFRVGAYPVITQDSPQQGPVATTVTLDGQYFGPTQGSSTVTFGGVAGTPTSWSDTHIVVPVPSGAPTGTAYICVTTSVGASNGAFFRVGAYPTITQELPQQGPVGTSVTISGQYFGATQGSSTVTFGGVAGTPTSWSDTQIVVPVPSRAPAGTAFIYVTTSVGASNGAFFRVGIYPTIAYISPQHASVGATVTLNGQNFGATQGSSTITFNGTQATPTSWSDTQIVVPVPVGATTGQIWMTVGGAASGAYFAVDPSPSISSISPSSASIGTSITITGANFGSSQGSSMVKFNGTTATVTSWNNTQIVAAVPSGATSGNVLVTVGSASSNAFNFTVVAPPSITASIFPAPNGGGWNNSAVYVTFTCSPGGLPIAFCPASQTINTEGANQVVSGTAMDTSGDIATASVTLNIEKTPPTLTVASPADQSVVTSSALAVSGSSANSLTAVNSVTCNGATAASTAGSFSCNLSLAAGVNLVMVRASDVAGNVSGARLHVIYAAALPPPASLQISPASANVLVGATQQFSAIDEFGRPRTDATWTVDNSNIATISTDASPVLTGVTAGTVTLTASIGGVSAQIQVNVLAGTSLPVGTVLWSAPSTPGFAVQQIVQAVPSNNGPHVYSIETDDNNTPLVRALTADGRQSWATQLAQGSYNYSVFGQKNAAMPDGNGGIILKMLTNPGSSPPSFQIVDIDPQTGTQVWAHTLGYDPTSLTQQAAIRGDGAVFKLESVQGRGAVIGIDPTTGSTTFMYVPPQNSYAFDVGSTTCPSQTGSSPSDLSPPTVGPDGTVYSVVTRFDLTASCNFGPLSITMTNSLLQVTPNSTTSLTQLRQDISNQTYGGGSLAGTFTLPHSSTTVPLYQLAPTTSFFHAIPDGLGGLLIPYGLGVAADAQHPPLQGHVTHLANGGGLNDFTLPFVPFGGTVLGENNAAFATDQTSLAAFDATSGQNLWSYSSPSGHSIDILTALDPNSGGSVAVNDSQAGIISFDPVGHPTQITSGNPVLLPSFSWNGSWTALSTNLVVSGATIPIAADPTSLWTTALGGPSENGLAAPLDPSSFLTADPQPPNSTCPICNLQPPNCLTMQGIQPTYLILIGDPGLNTGPGPEHHHNLGDLLNLSAEQKANELNQQGLGNWVVACRVSSIQDFNAALTEVASGEFFPTTITGGVFYFGHAAFLPDVTGKLHAILAPGEGTGIDTNIGDFNITTLQNTQLGPNITIMLNGCNAGSKTPDFNLPSIGQLLALQLQRTVFAYDVGVYFSHEDVDHDTHFNGLDVANGQGVIRKISWGLPMYAVPAGVPGHKPSPMKFSAH